MAYSKVKVTRVFVRMILRLLADSTWPRARLDSRVHQMSLNVTTVIFALI